MSELTHLLSKVQDGDSNAAEKLLPLVYKELRKLAAARLAREKPGQTLQATALVHEAYVRLVGGEAERTWEGRGHFFAAAAEAMRRILVEQARRKMSARRGGGLRRVELLDEDLAGPPGDERILALDEALIRLAQVRPQAARLVQLRFFAGLTVEEAAQTIGISSRSARRVWVFAQAWLRREMQSPEDSHP